MYDNINRLQKIVYFIQYSLKSTNLLLKLLKKVREQFTMNHTKITYLLTKLL